MTNNQDMEGDAESAGLTLQQRKYIESAGRRMALVLFLTMGATVLLMLGGAAWLDRNAPAWAVLLWIGLWTVFAFSKKTDDVFLAASFAVAAGVAQIFGWGEA